MTQEEIKEILSVHGLEETSLFENPSYETAFIGISHDDRAVYDYDKMVEYLVEKDGISEEDAADFVCYNTLRSLPYYENSPIVVFDYNKYF